MVWRRILFEVFWDIGNVALGVWHLAYLDMDMKVYDLEGYCTDLFDDTWTNVNGFLHAWVTITHPFFCG